MSNRAYALKWLGAECAKARKRNNVTQLQIAMKAECSVENISAFEHGRNSNICIFAQYAPLFTTLNDTMSTFRGVLDGDN